ncbi:hypothetical protein K2173_028307 [Erythroxylum novogranatense]|uniref:Uncharacterized protein n=1 Tax=Erythroxylum novogranatense TaxID=1862640 RepID=A0AAV8U576_9ROSI|nr:hypothetical protein K2173_028307 [Erythroxylum novogranatense]
MQFSLFFNRQTETGITMMCSETSPRVSFSNDLSPEDDLSTKRESRGDTKLLDSSSDFEFSICSSLDHEPSLADELFADGMILPLQIHGRAIDSDKQRHRDEPSRMDTLPPLPRPLTTADPKREESSNELMVLNSEMEEKPPSKSFWGFKRSTSLNCDIKRSLICSLPLLSRSNSTGAVPTPKKISMKDFQKHNTQKQQSNCMKNSVSTSSSSAYMDSIAQKPPLKKSYGGFRGNGVRINHVLNVPPPYISKGTANLLGFGSFLSAGKDKKNKK